MRRQDGNQYVGIGLYTSTEAARLAGVTPQRVVRWLRGYQYAYRGEARQSPPVWNGQIEPLEGSYALGFLDLMELRFVKAFLDFNLSLQTVRRAIARARESFGISHPFCTNQFLTDGRTIFLELEESTDEPAIIDLVKNQYAFHRVLKPYLKGVEYEGNELRRWWPLGERRRVVIDPARSFGKPIASGSGVQTAIIARAVAREGSVAKVQRWFELDKREVSDSVRFEERFAA